MHVQRNDQLKPENSHRWLMYLVEGSLTLYSGKDEVGSIQAGTKEALQPLFHDKGVHQSARTSTMAKIVRFGREQLDILLKEQQKNAVSVQDVSVGELDNLVFDDIVEAMANNTITLAISRESATKLSDSYTRVASIPELADVIQSDAGLAAHIVNAANRVESGTNESTSSIRGAITRLGVKETRRNIAALLESNSITTGNDVIAQRLVRYIQRTSLSASIVQVLTREVAHLKPDVAILVALTADIGELAVLSYANKYPEKFTDNDSLSSVIRNLRGFVSGWLLDAWNFPHEFLEAAHKCALGIEKVTVSTTPSYSVAVSPPSARKRCTTSSTSISGADAPAVTPTFCFPQSQPGSISTALVISRDSTPARSPSSASRLLFELLLAPTTNSRSTSSHSFFTASWRFWVA